LDATLIYMPFSPESGFRFRSGDSKPLLPLNRWAETVGDYAPSASPVPVVKVFLLVHKFALLCRRFDRCRFGSLPLTFSALTRLSLLVLNMKPSKQMPGPILSSVPRGNSNLPGDFFFLIVTDPFAHFWRKLLFGPRALL